MCNGRTEKKKKLELLYLNEVRCSGDKLYREEKRTTTKKVKITFNQMMMAMLNNIKYD